MKKLLLTVIIVFSLVSSFKYFMPEECRALFSRLNDFIDGGQYAAIMQDVGRELNENSLKDGIAAVFRSFDDAVTEA